MQNAGEWWKKNITDVVDLFLRTGGDPNVSDAYLINGQPGDLYPCSKSGIIENGQMLHSPKVLHFLSIN